jgi:hypothetical protein
MKRFFLLVTALTVLGADSFAVKPEVVIGPGLNTGRTQYFQGFNRTLSAETTYVLTGLYFVSTGFSLTIEPGTVIKGDTAATLIVQPGAQIFANGTATAPIVFTSRKAAGARAPGDWGGIVILGNAPTNQTAPLIEGGIIPGSYGGALPNDNSGVFRYVRIEFPGYRFQTNNEVNGLTRGGVGRGTTIEYVQVSYSFDDSYEWFGGTVDAKYLVAYGGTDDEFDSDFGWQGRVQFAFGMKDPAQWDPTGETNGFESDNEGSASYKNPRTFPRFSNMTMVGPRRTDGFDLNISNDQLNRHQYAGVMRRGTIMSLYNSAVLGYQGGWSFRDLQTLSAMQGDTLQFRNVSLASISDPDRSPALAAIHVSTTTYPSGWSSVTDLVNWYNTVGWNNTGSTSREPSTIGLTSLASLTAPDPRPAAGSELLTAGVEFTNLNALAGGFFTPTTYRGAFAPTGPTWMEGWTQFDPKNYNPETFTVTASLLSGWNLVSLPVLPADLTPAANFPGAVNVFSYLTGTYATPVNLQRGEGYWALYGSAATQPLSGESFDNTSLTASTGGRWYLIGSATANVPVSTDLTTSPSGQIASGPFEWTGSAYTTPTNLEPGKGYWVLLTGPATINIGQ